MKQFLEDKKKNDDASMPQDKKMTNKINRQDPKAKTKVRQLINHRKDKGRSKEEIIRNFILEGQSRDDSAKFLITMDDQREDRNTFSLMENDANNNQSL